MGHCLTCLLYWGAVSILYFRNSGGELAPLFLGKFFFLNTLSGVYRGLLGDYPVSVSPHGWFGGAPRISPSSGAGIWCSLCQDVHDQDSAPQLEVSFVQYYHAQTGSFCLVLSRPDWLVLFQISLLQNKSVNSLFYSFVSRLV